MTDALDLDVRAFVCSRLGLDGAPLPDDFDLLAEGVIDSFGLLELVLAFEERYGVELDLEGLEPDELTRLGSLCTYVAAEAGRR